METAEKPRIKINRRFITKYTELLVHVIWEEAKTHPDYHIPESTSDLADVIISFVRKYPRRTEKLTGLSKEEQDRLINY